MWLGAQHTPIFNAIPSASDMIFCSFCASWYDVGLSRDWHSSHSLTHAFYNHTHAHTSQRETSPNKKEPIERTNRSDIRQTTDRARRADSERREKEINKPIDGAEWDVRVCPRISCLKVGIVQLSHDASEFADIGTPGCMIYE